MEGMADMNGYLSRSQVAKRVGVTVKTLYNWERQGLIPPPERDGRNWRRYPPETVGAIQSYYESIFGAYHAQPTRMPELLSARNHLKGIVKSVQCDGIMAEVTLDLGNGNEIVSIITRSSCERLDIKKGDTAYAVIKATEVLVAK